MQQLTHSRPRPAQAPSTTLAAVAARSQPAASAPAAAPAEPAADGGGAKALPDFLMQKLAARGIVKGAEASGAAAAAPAPAAAQGPLPPGWVRRCLLQFLMGSRIPTAKL